MKGPALAEAPSIEVARLAGVGRMFRDPIGFELRHTEHVGKRLEIMTLGEPRQFAGEAGDVEGSA